jgi:hypothetical protein
MALLCRIQTDSHRETILDGIVHNYGAVDGTRKDDRWCTQPLPLSCVLEYMVHLDGISLARTACL